MQNQIQNTVNNQTPQSTLQLESKQVSEKQSNTYAKYCPNVWLAKCQQTHEKGEIIKVTNRHGKETDCEVHNLVVHNSNGYYYSITRCDGFNRQTYAERKAEKYNAWSQSAQSKSIEWFEKSLEGREFLSLAEPIKVGHHSEHRHRALIERNHTRMGKSVAEQERAEYLEDKAEYWESRKNDIDLSMPESVEYFAHKLAVAQANHQGMKDGSIPRETPLSLSRAAKEVKELKSKLETAKKLWS